ncbi:hypothetical protein F2P56_008573 [Juglans regia]|uniref:UPF0481 protein At3g47200-like n=2 Tax=Juglans regia TaxID=51240 RepID=A0A2I4DMQ1_JUGRE|nr:UPF0481 protein At3g47200-like [Juglans regia]KAF5471806.1 hypothetical protein F2P56_008573 [Juglans regia]
MAGCGEHVISMEELLSKKVNVVITEAGETSRGRDNSGLRRRIIEIGEEACELKKKRFEKLRKAASDHLSINTPNGGQNATPKIQKVPLLLQDHKHFDKYFKPRIVAIGPIHHGEPKYKRAEVYKLRMASYFVKDSGRKDDILYDIVEKNIEQLRQCFDEKVTEKYSDQALAWMLFVDGCAILQSIHCAVSNNCKDWTMKYDLMAFTKQDLFLLENQLPYQLLVDLMNSSAKKAELEKCIPIFINQQAVYNKSQPCENGLPTTERPIHLLDLLRTKIMKGNRQSTNGPIKAGDKSKSTNTIQSFLRLLSCKRRLRESEDSKQNGERLKLTYRNVEELRAAGIYMRCNDSEDPLTTIRFNRLLGFYPGYLWLSPITVDDAMGPKFLNLIAYEMCPDFYNKFEITSYILFLDSLIDNIKDVMVLRNKGILKNCLGSDEEVARLFNEIGTDLVPDPDAYGDVKDAIQRHYDAKWMNWIAEALHEHFRSPWTFMAFSAAIIVLSLTFIQTWFAIFKEDAGNSRPRVRR